MQSNIAAKDLATDERVAVLTRNGKRYVGTVRQVTSGRLDFVSRTGLAHSLRRDSIQALRSLDRNN